MSNWTEGKAKSHILNQLTTGAKGRSVQHITVLKYAYMLIKENNFRTMWT